jgi:hypothetical protein
MIVVNVKVSAVTARSRSPIEVKIRAPILVQASHDQCLITQPIDNLLGQLLRLSNHFVRQSATARAD